MSFFNNRTLSVIIIACAQFGSVACAVPDLKTKPDRSSHHEAMPGSVLTDGTAQPFQLFPGETWARRSPADAGLKPEVLAKIEDRMRASRANGALIHRGYLVAEWNYGGPSDRRFEVQSITKSITGLLLGLALEDGLIPDLDATVKSLYPDFSVGPYTDEITFRHLITATSGIRATISNYVDPGNMPPGVESRYHNDHTQELGAALTYLFGRNLEEVLHARLLRPINAFATWEVVPPLKADGTWLQFSPGVLAAIARTVRLASGEVVVLKPGFALTHWTAQDLARVGWLCLNDGRWSGQQILPHDYMRQIRKPIPQPVFPFRKVTVPGQAPQDLSRLSYGMSWWGYNMESHPTIWYMSGHGKQFCAVLPEHGIVMTKINEWIEPSPAGMEEFASLLIDLADR